MEKFYIIQSSYTIRDKINYTISLNMKILIYRTVDTIILLIIYFDYYFIEVISRSGSLLIGYFVSAHNNLIEIHGR